MDFKLLNKLVVEGEYSKSQISNLAKISRTTLDNVLNGADVKISTLERLSKVLGVSPSIFFNDELNDQSTNLHTLPQNCNGSVKIVVELNVSSSEFSRMELKEMIERSIKDNNFVK